MEPDPSQHRRRCRRKRRSHHSRSDSPKPLSIDLLKKKRHKNAKRQRIASARLDLDEGTTFSGGSSRQTMLGRLLAIVVVTLGVVLVLNDIGWGVIRDGLANFITGVGRGAQESISGGRDEQAASLSAQTALQDQLKPKVSGIFQPAGSQEALDKMNLAMQARKVGLISQAIDLLDEAQQADPEVVGVSLMKGYVFLEKDDFDKAKPHFIEALEKPGEKLFAALALGKECYERGTYGEAAKYFAMAREWKPDEASTAHKLSLALRMDGRPMEGLFEARQAHEMFPGNKLYEVSVRLAAIQAGESSPPSDPDPVQAAPQGTLNRGEAPIRSPFELVVEAGEAAYQGNWEQSAQRWETISTYMDVMPVLRELKEDPLFRLEEASSGQSPPPAP